MCARIAALLFAPVYTDVTALADTFSRPAMRPSLLCGSTTRARARASQRGAARVCRCASRWHADATLRMLRSRSHSTKDHSRACSIIFERGFRTTYIKSVGWLNYFNRREHVHSKDVRSSCQRKFRQRRTDCARGSRGHGRTWTCVVMRVSFRSRYLPWRIILPLGPREIISLVSTWPDLLRVMYTCKQKRCAMGSMGSVIMILKCSDFGGKTKKVTSMKMFLLTNDFNWCIIDIDIGAKSNVRWIFVYFYVNVIKRSIVYHKKL